MLFVVLVGHFVFSLFVLLAYVVVLMWFGLGVLVVSGLLIAR